MRRFFLIFLCLGMLVGGVSAQPQVDNITMVGGEEYTLTYEGGVDNIIVDGPIETDSEEVDGNVEIQVEALEVSGESTAQIILQRSSGREETQITVYPEASESDDGEIDQGMGELEDQWVNHRVERVTTDEGTLVVYEQRDPTRGSIDPESGLPEGEWVQVPVDEDGDPEWLFETPHEALQYTSVQANTRYSERTWWIVGAFGIVAASIFTQAILIPKYRKREEQDFLYGE